MMRRMCALLICAVLSCVGLAACASEPLSPKDWRLSPTMEGWTSAPPVTAEEMAAPPSMENSIVPVSTPVDTTNFTARATVSGWFLSDEETPTSVVVTIRLSKDDWSAFAKQINVDETIDPSRLQLGTETARSLIDLDALAEEIIQFRKDRGVTPVDIRTLHPYDFYNLEVSGR